jgi:phosphoserine aminotransferase
MITFYPGPSKVYDEVEHYLKEAFDSGLISANHRSAGFMQMLEETIGTLKMKLNVPADYEVYLVSSATECWEIIAQSLITTSSLHIYNGAFGEKWMEYTQKLTGNARCEVFGLNESLDIDKLRIETDDVICLTQNETSNGTAISADIIDVLRSKTNNLIAVDATSSMAGVELPWESADVWYASVQKCFGLPAGMGIMIVSPNAIAQAEKLGERSHYNSLLFIRDNFIKFQTPYTPNTLGIYLLGKVMQQVSPVSEVDAQTRKRSQEWYSFLKENGYRILVENDAVRSETVIAVQDSRENIDLLKKAAKERGITLGNGYGKEKDTSFRIANFPAITENEIDTLKKFLAGMTSK